MKLRLLLQFFIYSLILCCTFKVTQAAPIKNIKSGVVYNVVANSSPSFVNGSSQSLAVCQNSGSTSIDSYLAITDADQGQTLTWSIVKAPSNGIVHGFPGIGSSNGSTVTPAGFDYTPSTGFSGSDQFIVAVSDGTVSVQTTINVTVNPTVAITPITGQTAICLGTSTLLSNATDGGVWTSSNTAVATVAADGTVTAVATGTTTISYIVTNASGCSSIVTTTFTVSGFPFVAAIQGTNTVCANATTQLSSTTAGGVWSSGNTAVATVNTTGLVTGVAGTNFGTQATITYTVTNTAGCSASRSSNVTVYAAPNTPTITSTTTTGCINTTIQLTATGGGGGGVTTATWASSNTAVATVTNAGFVTGISAGTASISYTLTNFRGCSSAAKQDVSFGDKPVVDAISGVSSICLGNTVQLSNTTPNGTWRSGNTNIATIDANGLVTPITAGTATLFYTVTTSGCATTVGFNLLINDKPAIGSIVGTNTTCVGTSTTLSNTTSGGVWTSSNTKISTVSSSGVVTGVGVGTDTIYYTVTNAAGCFQTVFVPFTVANGISVGAITGNKTICVGNNTTLSNTTTGGVWSTSDAAIASITSGGVVTGVAAGKATVTYAVSGGAGCFGSATAEITVLTSPVLSAISGTTSVCVGQTSQLTNSTSGGLWISSNNAVATVSSTGLVTAVSNGNTQITYTVINAGGCSQSVTAIVTVNNLPNAGRIVGTNSICIGSTVTYTNNAFGGVWSSSNTKVATIDANGAVVGVASGTTEIRYTVTNGNGCTSFSSLTLDVNPVLVVDTIIGSKSVCQGAGNVTYRDSTIGGTWTSSNTAAAVINATTGVLTPVAQGSTVITYLVNNGTCSGSASLTVTVNSRPTQPTVTPNNGATVCAGSTTTFTGSPTGGYWTSSNTNIATIDSSTGVAYGVRFGQSNIVYTVSNAAGCTRSSQASQLQVFSLQLTTQINGTNNVCVKGTTQLTNNTTGGVWTTSQPSIATVNSATGLVTGVSAGTAIITYAASTGGQCPQSRTINITVNALPTVSVIGGTTSICVGKNSVLTNTAANGVWSTNNSAVSTISNLGVLTGVSAGSDSVYYTVTNNNNCVNKAGTQVSINALPIVGSITGTTSICVGKTSQLSNSTVGGLWSSSNTSVASISSSGLVSGVAAGTSTITYVVTNASGCVDSVSTTVTVNALPSIASITGSSSICVGKTLQLKNTTSGGSWTSATPSIATVNSISGVVTGKSAGVATIRYVVTNASGCIDSVSTSVTVNALPVIAAITGTTSICVGKTTTLSTTTLGGVTSNSNSSVASWVSGGSNSIIVTGLKAGTTKFTYVVTNASGCVDSVSTTVTVNALPVVGAIGGTTTLCVGKTSQLSNSAAGGVWSSSNTAVASISSSGLLTAVSAGTTVIKYVVTNASGCVDSTSTTVTVNALPIVGAIAGTTTLCVGKTSQLSNNTVGGLWSSSNTSVASISSSGLVSGVAAGTTTITYVVTNASGCVDSATATVTINALPVVGAITGTTGICVGKTTQLSNSTVGGVWSSSNTSVASVSSSGLVNGVAAGTSTITYVVTNGSGCVDSTSTTVTVNALPSIAAITGSGSICVGKTLQLKNTTSGGSWTSATPSIATVNSISGIVTGKSAGVATLRYVVTNASGCVDSVSTTVTVNALPVVGAIGGTTTLCVGKTSQLTNSAAGGVWSSSNTAVASISSSGLLTALSAGTSVIKYVVTNASGCVDSTSTTVTVNALPIVGVITGTTTLCVGKTSQLSNSTVGGLWSSSNTSVASISSSGLVSGVAAGTSTITYVVTNGSGCVDSTSTTVTINAVPVVKAGSNSPVNVGETIQLTASSSDGATYAWSGPLGFTSSAQNPSIVSATTDMSGDYSVTTTANGCTSNAATVAISVLNPNLVITGNVLNPLGTAIPGVTVSLSGGTAGVATTTANTGYSFTVPKGGDYTLTLSKNNDSAKSNGVSAIDFALIKSHILTRSLLNSPYKLLAADVDNSGSINAVDLIYVKRLILAIDSTFKGNRLWGFVDSNQVFTDPTNPFPVTPSVTLSALQTNKNQSFVGVKLGDVNYDWVNTVANANRKAPLEFYYDTAVVGEDGYVRIPVKAKRFNNMMGMQFTLHFNSDKFSYVGVNNKMLETDYGTTYANNGDITFLWNDPNNQAKSINDGHVVIELVLQRKANFDIEDIAINSNITPIEAFDAYFNTQGIIKTSGVIVNKQANPQYVNTVESLNQVLPNPTKGIVSLKINIAQAKTLYLHVTDVTGKQVLAQKLTLTAGSQLVTLNLHQQRTLQKGTYFLKIDGLNSGSITKPVIVE